MTNKTLRGVPKSNSETNNKSYLLEKHEGTATLSTQSKFSGVVGHFLRKESSQGVSATFNELIHYVECFRVTHKASILL